MITRRVNEDLGKVKIEEAGRAGVERHANPLSASEAKFTEKDLDL